MISLFVFLGNTGAMYAGNRHNVAWQCADNIHALSSTVWQNKFRAYYAEQTDEHGKKRFLKPQTFMNNSGESINEVVRFFKIAPKEILVVHDELELPFGTVSLKFGGGLGGHNGLRSTESVLGTRDFWRIRLGIGRPAHDDIAGYVLSDFLPSERDSLKEIFLCTENLFSLLFREEPDGLLSEWTKKKLIASPAKRNSPGEISG